MRVMILALAAVLLFSRVADAHQASDSFLTLTLSGKTVTGQWDIALRDLDHAIGLDADGDGAITWGEVRSRQDEIAGYALARLRIGPPERPCDLRPVDQMVDRHADGAYAVLVFRAECAEVPSPLPVAYRLFSDLDPQHRGLLQVREGEQVLTAVFGPDRPDQEIATGDADVWSRFATFVREGARHIWIGYDHILFLIALLLPAVVVRRDGAWRPVEGLAPAFVATAKLVTAFTLAHSITLGLAALAVVSLPSRLVESLIAASVVLAALNNIRPIVTRRLWLLAFGFGLVHGFGFAAVLRDLGLPPGATIVALAGFNIGVEAGQLAIVAVFLPVAWWLRRRAAYGDFAVPLSSGAIATLGGVWLVARAFDVAVWPV